MFQVVDTSSVFVACAPVKERPDKIALGRVKAPVRVPPVSGSLVASAPPPGEPNTEMNELLMLVVDDDGDSRCARRRFNSDFVGVSNNTNANGAADRNCDLFIRPRVAGHLNKKSARRAVKDGNP